MYKERYLAGVFFNCNQGVEEIQNFSGLSGYNKIEEQNYSLQGE